MHLIQLLLPLYDNNGIRLPKALYSQVRAELVGQFGGLTAYTQAPASGLWQEDGGDTVHDDLIIYEVMCDDIDANWWHAYRTTLEGRFLQQKLVVRSHPVRML
jgi:hypothetical protein